MTELEMRVRAYAAELGEDVRSEQRQDESDAKKTQALTVFYRGEKIIVVLHDETSPLRIETRCDYRLGKALQERYESVMQSKALGNNGIEVICSGQMSEEEVIDLVRHAYEIAA